ncbi:G-type lectin S-receptor-like serine/threonine-protein kinase RKS1 [Cinnamomum micranthum f. kanehirae]|uniref:non-specific serine/threonine protein kinase n=1 Tax=Cinnamomum micranthum f. kanehirae TaxID=337451 RepID=A0A443PBQ1_9MAGN|nr:G-type lectin S-receptor-like serine/threonine-protein kinase RKS1 [Cinnamomum micranthum f. kanehirae]
MECNTSRWNLMWVVNQDRCDQYGICGAYGSCDSNRIVECECLRGFEPKTPSDWNLRDWSGGCVRRRSLDCDGKGDGFIRLERVKLPDTSRSWVEPGLSLEACKEECLKNCSCTAYASAYISEGNPGCLMWNGNLVDLKVISDGEQDIYTRVAASELVDTLTPIQSVRDGETLISAGEKFVLGFFSPDNYKNRYVGIWYNKIPNQTIVWTANRENPVRNSSGILTIKGGNLVLLDGGDNNNIILWSTNVSSSTMANNSSARLTDSGNLVLKDGQQRTSWESFDYPTNTYLPRMKLGFKKRTGLNRILTSWKSADDPAPGEFSLGLDPRGVPQYFLRMGSERIWRSGPWNGQRLIGVPLMNRYSVFSWSYVTNDDEIYLMYDGKNSSITARYVLDRSGLLQRLIWNDNTSRWNLMSVATQDRCDQYGNCGAYGSCDSSRVVECECLRGFEPKAPSDWNLRDWSGGCVRRRSLDCDGKGDGFIRLERVKLPDTSRSWVEPDLSLEACKEECLKNCSCTAYASAYISEGNPGCLMWNGDLVDLKVISDGEQDIYTRVAASELDGSTIGNSGGLQGKKKLLVTILTIIPGLFLFVLCGYCWWRKAKGCEMNEKRAIVLNGNDIEENGKGLELPLFNVSVIAAATNNFAESNLLGKGGFGFVYKGQLLNGQEIAVKRLSQNSSQGIEEFKNEITLIAKLQHRNLVRLLGYGINGQEKILIYEYMRNKSLDSLIFDQTTSAMLDWRKRFRIIGGIARGILYLHEDSRLRIIHRDLKVSNILLDDDMNARISDFGMARIFGQDQAQANTNRVVGTYGYMSPEYAMHGRFSVKSDAFSFGVILLEIISGKRNNYCSDCCSMNLIGHVWEKWKEGKALEVVDSSMNMSSSESEVLRCIQVGLLCVQEKAKDRPNMSSVIFMLDNETMMLSPQQPAFYFGKGNCSDRQHVSTNGIVSCSINDVTMTKMEAR